MRGRPSLPDEVKKRKGTFKKIRENKDPVITTIITEIPEPPPLFDDVAKNVWNTVCSEMIKLNLLQTLDIYMLEILCYEMSIYWDCQAEIMKQGYTIPTGTGSVKVNPKVTVANTALNNVQRIAAKFGLTPSDRARLKLTGLGGIEKKNPAKELLEKRKQLGSGKGN